MKKLEYFQSIGKRGFYRPQGEVSFELAVEMVAAAIKHARELGFSSLFVDTTSLTGVSPPSIFGRHALAVKWAASAGAHLHVAIVTRPELIDPDRIGVIMAQNRGASGNVFTNEAAALAWLNSRHHNTSE